MASSSSTLTSELTLTDFENLYQEIVTGCQDSSSPLHGHFKMLKSQYYKFLKTTLTRGESHNLATSLKSIYSSSGSTYQAIMQDIENGGHCLSNLLNNADKEEFFETLSNINNNYPVRTQRLEVIPAEIKTGESVSYALIAFAMGGKCLEQKEWMQARHNFVLAFLLATKENNRLVALSALQHIAHSFNEQAGEFTNQQNWQEASRYYKYAVETAKNAAEEALMIISTTNLARVLFYQGKEHVEREQWLEACGCFKQSAEAATESHDNILQQQALENFSLALYSQGLKHFSEKEWDMACSYLRHAAQLNAELKEQALEKTAEALDQQGCEQIKQDKLQEACDCFQLSLDIAKDIKNQKIVHQSSRSLAAVLTSRGCRLGNSEEGWHCFQQALVIVEDINAKDIKVKALEALSDWYFNKGMDCSSEEEKNNYLIQAAETAANAGSVTHKAQALCFYYFGIGMKNAGEGKWEQANEAYKLALVAVDALNNPQLEESILLRFVQSCFQLGRDQFIKNIFLAAHDYFGEVIRQKSRLMQYPEFQDILRQALIFDANLLLTAGYRATAYSIPQGVEFFNQALERAKEVNDPDLTANVYSALTTAQIELLNASRSRTEYRVPADSPIRASAASSSRVNADQEENQTESSHKSTPQPKR